MQGERYVRMHTSEKERKQADRPKLGLNDHLDNIITYLHVTLISLTQGEPFEQDFWIHFSHDWRE